MLERLRDAKSALELEVTTCCIWLLWRLSYNTLLVYIWRNDISSIAALKTFFYFFFHALILFVFSEQTKKMQKANE